MLHLFILLTFLTHIYLFIIKMKAGVNRKNRTSMVSSSETPSLDTDSLEKCSNSYS